MPVSGPALGVILAAAFVWLLGVQTWHGIKWVGHQVKRGGTAVVHVIKGDSDELR